MLIVATLLLKVSVLDFNSDEQLDATLVFLLVAGHEGRLLASRVRVSIGLLSTLLVLSIRLLGWGALATGTSVRSGALLVQVVVALGRALLLLLLLC